MKDTKRQTSFSIEKETYDIIMAIKKYYENEENIKISNSAIVDKAVKEWFEKNFNDETQKEFVAM